MSGPHLARLLMMGPTPSEIAARATGAATTVGGVVVVAAQNVFAGLSAGAVAGGLMILSGAGIAAYGNWRGRRREEQAKDDDYRRRAAEADALNRRRIEEIDAGSLAEKLAKLQDSLDHLEERLEDANGKLHRATSDRDAMQMQMLLQTGELQTLRKQLGLPAGPDPELASDQQVTLPGLLKQSVKDAIHESHDEIPTDEWPKPKDAP